MSDIKDQIIEKQEELIKNLTNQLLLGEPETFLQEKQYKIYCADEEELRGKLASLKSQALQGRGEKKKLRKPCLTCDYWTTEGTGYCKNVALCFGYNQYEPIESITEQSKQSDSTPDLCCGKYE
jgi:hypothetical protein